MVGDLRHVTQNGKNGDASENGGGGVDDGDDDGIPHAIVGESVVGGHGDETAVANAQRVEDLNHGIGPHGWLGQLRPLRPKVEQETLENFV